MTGSQMDRSNLALTKLNGTDWYFFHNFGQICCLEITQMTHSLTTFVKITFFPVIKPPRHVCGLFVCAFFSRRCWVQLPGWLSCSEPWFTQLLSSCQSCSLTRQHPNLKSVCVRCWRAVWLLWFHLSLLNWSLRVSTVRTTYLLYVLIYFIIYIAHIPWMRL